MVAVKAASFALLLMAHVLPVIPDGTVHGATTPARLVSMVTAARTGVHDAGIMNPVTQKLGRVTGVIPDGLDPGLYLFVRCFSGTLKYNDSLCTFYRISVCS